MKDKKKMKKENVVIDLEAKTKEEAIDKMSYVLYENGYVSDLSVFIDSVKNRENQMSTGIGNEIAIPHGASATVKESTVVFAKLKNPIEWDSLDSKLVKYVFLLAINNQKHAEEHIRILANLATDLMDNEYVSSIKNAQSVDEIYEVINEGGKR